MIEYTDTRLKKLHNYLQRTYKSMLAHESSRTELTRDLFLFDRLGIRLITNKQNKVKLLPGHRNPIKTCLNQSSKAAKDMT